jgi:hypothetical protein
VAKYIVTGAAAQVRTAAQDGTPVLVYRYRGDVVELTGEQAAHLVDVGLVEKVADVLSDPLVNPPAGVVGKTPEQVVTGRPADDADKVDWVAYAVSRGLAQSDAEIANVADLVAMYGDQTPAPAPAPVVVLQRPQTDGSKADWVAYAIQQGIPQDEAEKLTRDKLATDERLKA